MSDGMKESKIELTDQSIDPVTQLSFNGCTYPIFLPNGDTDYIQKKLRSERIPYELDMLRDMQRRLSEGDFVLDIGANIGNHTLFLAVIAKCKVTAFEPNEALCGPLLKSIELNLLGDRVGVRPVALGKGQGVGHFTKLVPENSGAQSIKVGKGGIPIAPLDSFQFPQPIKAIKIDVEGMELDVLEGGIHRIQTDRPIIYVECQTEKEFRTIHDWFSKIDYGYWDTFNATPTHLFLPNERTTLDQRIARLQFKIVQDDYRLSMQLSAVRQKLDDAQVKYRTATEEVSTLKQRVAGEETARKLAEQTQRQVAGQLEQTKCYLQEEQTALQQQVAQLSQQEHAHSAAAEEAAKNLLRLKTELEAMRGRLEEANQKYRGATEQVSALKLRVTEEERARQAAEQAQVQASIKLKAELEVFRVRLEEANQKYRGATEQVAALKEQMGQLSQQEHAHSAAADEAAKNLLRQKAELEAMRGRLEEANQKYRGATEQVGTLKHQIAQEEAMQQGAEKARAQASTQLAEAQRSFQEERKAFQQQLSQLSQEGQAKTVTVHEGEKNLIRLEAELEARSRLEEANHKYQAATEQISRLTQQAKQEEVVRKTAEQALQAAENWRQCVFVWRKPTKSTRQ
jgi:FkbM family methyltransferase